MSIGHFQRVTRASIARVGAVKTRIGKAASIGEKQIKRARNVLVKDKNAREECPGLGIGRLLFLSYDIHVFSLSRINSNDLVTSYHTHIVHPVNVQVSLRLSNQSFPQIEDFEVMGRIILHNSVLN